MTVVMIMIKVVMLMIVVVVKCTLETFVTDAISRGIGGACQCVIHVRAFSLLEENHSSVHGIHVCVCPTSTLKVSFNRIQLNTATPRTEVSILIILTFAYSDMGGRSTGCS